MGNSQAQNCYQSTVREAIIESWEEIPLAFIRSCITGLPSKMDKAIEDANAKLITDQDDIEDSNNEGYDSFGDEYDSEDITDDDYETESDDNLHEQYFKVCFV